MRQLTNDSRNRGDDSNAQQSGGASGPAKKSWIRRWGREIGAAAVGGTVIALLLMRGCQPMAETICDPPRQAQPNDGHCEVALGEHDPASTTFDPQSCGFCGDGVRNIWKVNGLEVGRETEEACPVDFHCGNGVNESGTVFGGIVHVEQSGTNVYRYGLITITESCTEGDAGYCRGEGCPPPSAAVPAPSPPARRPSAKSEPAPENRPERPSSKLSPCPAEVQGMAQAKDLRDTVRGIFRESAGALRRKIGASSASDRVTISANLTIEGGRVVGVSGISGSCNGTCSKTKLSGRDILGITGSLDVNGEAAPQTRSKCFIPVTYNPRD